MISHRIYLSELEDGVCVYNAPIVLSGVGSWKKGLLEGSVWLNYPGMEGQTGGQGYRILGPADPTSGSRAAIEELSFKHTHTNQQSLL